MNGARPTLLSVAMVFGLSIMLAGESHARKQVETEHYVVVFDEGNEFWAQEVIAAAESVWSNLVADYELQDEYKKVYIYVEDAGDYADGWTLPSRNRVTVGTTALDMGIRSSDNWIRNVVTHELSHVFSIKAANKDGFFKNWWIGRSSSYQNPDVSAAFHYRDLLAPQWWVEGAAQYGAWRNGNDRWDTHRDMLLRMAVLEDDLLDESELSSFDTRHGFYPEMTYNQGFSMMLYIDSVYGRDAAGDIATHKSMLHFSHSLRRATGRNLHQLYREWKASVATRYGAAADSITPHIREGRVLYDGGFWDWYGTYSPDGSRAAFISNRGSDVIYTKLYVMNLDDGSLVRIREHGTTGVSPRSMPGGRGYGPSALPATRPAAPELDPLIAQPLDARGPSVGSPAVMSKVGWSRDGNLLCYSRRGDNNAYRDIYLYDLRARRERRITWEARARDPSISPDGRTIAYIHNDRGTSQLALVDTDGRKPRYLTNFNNGTQLYGPSWSSDGKHVYVGILRGANRDIMVARTDAVSYDRYRAVTDTSFFPDTVNYQDDLQFWMVVHSEADERDPCVSPDGRYLYYSSDRTGVFNIYRMDLQTWQVEQITNVLGGAFAPSVSGDGLKVLYTGFHAANYSLFEIDVKAAAPVSVQWKARDDYQARFDEKKLMFSGSPGNGQYRVGEYRPRLTLWWFEPYLSWQPAYITDSVGISQMRTGVWIQAGELHGNVTAEGSAYISKDFDDHAGPSYGLDLTLAIKAPGLFGENRDLRPEAHLFGAREVVRGEQPVTSSFDQATTDFTRTPPNEYALLVDGATASARDTLIGVYVDGYGGFFRDERTFTQYGVTAGLALNLRNHIGLYYARLSDRISGSYTDYQLTQFARVMLVDGGGYGGVLDVTEDDPAGVNAAQHYALEYWRDSIAAPAADTTARTDIPDVYLDFNIYADHRVGVSYQYTDIRPSFGLPSRVDYFGIGLELMRSDLTRDSYFGGGNDTLFERNGARDLQLNFSEDGSQIAHVAPVTQSIDFARIEASVMERFPLPGNRAMGLLRRPWRSNHYATVGVTAGSVNRALPEDAITYPLEYRISRYLKAYPFSFDPIDLGTVDVAFPVDRYAANGDSLGVDSLRYSYLGDTTAGDILWGNGIIHYSFEYTLELARGVSVPALGVSVKGLYVTPFFEAAAVWNEDWRDFDPDILSPFTTRDGRLRWRDDYLRDWGIRAELLVQFAHTWNALVSFTWARRLDLGNQLAGYEEEGNRVTRTYLDHNRYSLTVHVW